MPLRISKHRVKLESIPLQLAQSSAIASAATVDLSTATGNTVHITGSTGPITSFGTVPTGTTFTLIFDSTPTLTYNATSLILNTGGTDYTAEAGDRAIAVSQGGGNWIVTIFKEDGESVIGAPRVQRWAYRFNGVGQRFSVMTSPPSFVRGTGTSSVNTNYVNGQTMFDAQSTVFDKRGSIFVNETLTGSRAVATGRHITQSGGTRTAGNAPLRIRFLSDAPAIDLCFYDAAFSALNAIVDGQFVSRDKPYAFTNTGNYKYTKLDFGTDVVTYEKAQTSFSISNAGSADMWLVMWLRWTVAQQALQAPRLRLWWYK